MKRRVTIPVLLGLGLLAASGCAQLSLTPMPGGGHSSAPPPPAPRKEYQLPAHEQANVCIVAAEEQEKAGKPETWSAAVYLYEMARHKDPRQQHVCRRLAVLYDKLGHFAQSQQEYEKALQLYPNDADLLADLGYGMYCQGRLPEAERYLREAVKNQPDHKRAWTNLGMTLGAQEKYGESLEAFQKAVSPAQAYCNLAFLYASRGHYDMARRFYANALNEQPGLSLAQAALKKLENAESAPRTAAMPARKETPQDRALREQELHLFVHRQMHQLQADAPEPARPKLSLEELDRPIPLPMQATGHGAGRASVAHDSRIDRDGVPHAIPSSGP